MFPGAAALLVQVVSALKSAGIAPAELHDATRLERERAEIEQLRRAAEGEAAARLANLEVRQAAVLEAEEALAAKSAAFRDAVSDAVALFELVAEARQTLERFAGSGEEKP